MRKIKLNKDYVLIVKKAKSAKKSTKKRRSTKKRTTKRKRSCR